MSRATTKPRSSGSGHVFGTPVVGKNVGSAGLVTYLAWFVQAALWVFAAAALWTFDAGDWPSHAQWPQNAVTHNACGVVGAVPAYYAVKLLGFGAWVLLSFWGLYLFLEAFVSRVSHRWVRFAGLVVIAVMVAALQALHLPDTGPLAHLGGGTLGTVISAELMQRFSGFGSTLVLLVGLLIGAVVSFDVWVILAPKWAFQKAQVATPAVKTAAGVAAEHTVSFTRHSASLLSSLLNRDTPVKGRKLRPEEEDDVDAALDQATGAAPKKGKRKGAKEGPTEPLIDENAGGIGATEAFDPEHNLVDANGDKIANPKGRKKTKLIAAADDADEDRPEVIDEDEDEAESAEEAEADVEAETTSAAAEAKKAFTPEELRAKIAKLPLRFASTEKKSATDEDLRDIQNSTDLEGYKFPGLDLLEDPETGYSNKMEGYVREQAGALEKALREYKIEGEVVGIESGPVITLYEVKLAAGTKVSALGAVSSDLARALKAVNIRIVSNMEGRDTVGIEVPNPHKEKVRLKELMGKTEKYQGMNLPMFLGKDASGSPLIQDLAKMPHVLIAGTTGSGKSVCMSSILMSFLYTKKPNELKLVLVDPKMVELSQFKDIPHLMCPVVTEMSKAAAILEWAVRKMDERYELLAEAGCRDVASYNALTWEELKERFNPTDEVEEARIPKKLPYMVFVIDELADLIMTNREVETAIVRLAQKARAVGMHLILATQRPQANVVTGLIKSNMPSRIAFKVASGMDSRIVMDQKGAELLLGQGDMLFLSPRSSELTRAQGTLVDDREIRKVVKFLKEIAAPTFERSLMQIRTGAAVGGGIGGDDEGLDTSGGLNHDGLANAQADPLFDKAVEIVLETKIGSVSMLQRRMAIGYTRASRLIDAMGQAGIIGDHKGTVAREVLISPDEWQAMKAQAEADAAAGTVGESGRDVAKAVKQGTLFSAGAPGEQTAAVGEDDDEL